MTRRSLWIIFAAVVVGSLAVAGIVGSAHRSGANENKLQEVRKVLELKATEGKVVEQKRLVVGKAAASSHTRTELSRPAAIKSRHDIRVLESEHPEVLNYLKEPVDNLLTHDDNLERENADLRQLATVDTSVVKNLTERLELKQTELELTPKPSRCGRKCGITLGILGTLGAAIVLGAATK